MLKTGRTLAMTLAAWGCGLATTCVAQTYAAGDVVTLPGTAGGYDYSSGAFGDNGPAYGGVSGAGYQGMPANCPPQPGYGAACEPQPTCWWKRPLLISPRLLKPPRGAFFRTEYLLWEIEEPGTVSLGGQFNEVSNINPDADFDVSYFSNALFDNDFDPANGFLRFDPATGIDFAYQPNLEELQLRDNSGIRGTIGIPTYDYGTIELSGWALDQASDNYRFTAREFIPPVGVILPGVPFNPATIVKIDGEISSTSFAYNEELVVVYKSNLWGADAKFVVDSLSPPGEGLKLKPLFGFKYVGLQEQMLQRGVFAAPLSDSITTSINSNTSNTILGGTVGLRAELVHRWFTLGLQPAATLGGNISRARVVTERFIDNSDPRQESTSDYFDFSPVLELNAYTRVKLHENLNLTVGYDAFWMSRVYRPATSIDYNVATDGGTTARADFGTRRKAEHVAVEGLSVGLEYIF